MKLKKLLSMIVTLIAISAHAQFRTVPAEVTDAFREKFPRAQHVSWKDKLTSFQADFEQKNQKMKAYFSSKGEWQKSEKKVDIMKLPSDVRDGFNKSKYATYTIREIIEVDDSEKGLLYRVVVKKGDITKRSLFFTDEGQLVKDEVNF